VTIDSNTRAATLLIARIALAGIFIVAGLAKVQDATSFTETVRAFHLLPASLVVPFARALPWLEIVAGAYLLAGFFSRLAAAITGAMLVLFIIALGDALLTGDTAHSCGCFGGLGSNPVVGFLAGGNSIGWWDLIRDLILLGLAALIIRFGPGAWSADGLISGRSEPQQKPKPNRVPSRRRA